MPLSSLALNLSQSWALSVSNTSPFQATRQGTDSANFVWSSPSPTQLYGNVYTISASGTQNIDLTSLTNFVNESVNFSGGAIFSVLVIPTSGTVKVGPGSSNGFPVCGGTNTCTVPVGGVMLLACGSTGTGISVDSTHKILTLTEASGSASCTVELVITGVT